MRAAVPVPARTLEGGKVIFFFFLFLSSGGWVKVKLKRPHFRVSDTRRVSIKPDAPFATAARAKASGHVSMSTRPDPERSGAVEIATRGRPRLRVVWDLRELTQKKPRLWIPARLGPVTVHPTR